jgi:hypothetical protein
MLRDDLRAAGRWGIAAGLTLLAEHITLWPQAGRFGEFARPWTYALGTGTLLTAFAGWSAERRQGRALGAYTLITACGGAVVIAAYGVRAWRAGRPAPPPDPYAEVYGDVGSRFDLGGRP